MVHYNWINQKGVIVNSTEIRPGQGCNKTEETASKLEQNFMDQGAREHLVECASCRNSLGSKPPVTEGDQNIAKLANNFRDGIACSG